jgi:hypothetical protein
MSKLESAVQCTSGDTVASACEDGVLAVDLARVPDFAGQRVRQTSVVVQVVDGRRSGWCTRLSPFLTSSQMVFWMSSA